MRAIMAIGILAALAAPAWAHKPSDAHLRLSVDGSAITGRLDIAVRDLDAALAIDADGDGSIAWRELVAAEPRITTYVHDRISIQSCTINLDAGGVVDLSDGAYWAIPVTATCPAPVRELAVTYNLLFDVDAQHRGLIHVDRQTLIARSSAPVNATISGTDASFGTFVVEGIWHIWGGLDHVLFLLCLLIPAVFQRPDARWTAATSLKSVCLEVFEIVTAFTLAHSITLVISAVGFVQLPSRFVETAIALSVVAAAANNLARVIDARWAVAFALGLLHGFGFSSVLVDLGLSSHEQIGTLLGFNVGVELGQAAIVVAVLPVLFVIRRTLAYQAILWGGSTATVAIAAVWSYQRFAA